MPDIPVEDAVKANCEALIAGDLMKVMTDLSPEAMAQMMAAGGGGMGAMPQLTGYEILDRRQEGEDHVFTVKFTGSQEFTVSATWADFGGVWKIKALALPQPS